MASVETAQKARDILARNRKDLGVKDSTIRASGLANRFSHRFGSQWLRLYNLLEQEGEDEFLERIRDLPTEERYSAIDEKSLEGEAGRQAGVLLAMRDFYRNNLLDRGSNPVYDSFKNRPLENLSDEQRDDLIDSAIRAKSQEITSLEPYIGRFRLYLNKPTFANDIETVYDHAQDRLEQLRRLKAELYRVHLSHMWYTTSPGQGETPDPFAMVSVYAVTRNPDNYPRSKMEKALQYLENEAFTFWSNSGDYDQKARFKVAGWEKEPIDSDEVPDYVNTETLRYYVIFYPYPPPYHEYYGWMESPSGPIHREDDDTDNTGKDLMGDTWQTIKENAGREP